MRFNIFAPANFIFGPINNSISFVQYERFMRQQLGNTSRAISSKQSELKVSLSSSASLSKSNELINEEDDGESKFAEYEVSFGAGLISDIAWMLEYNQNGLMSLIIFVAHIIILILQIFKSICFISFPTDKDPNTGEFLNPWLKFCDSIYLTELTHTLEFGAACSQLFLVISLQSLVLRIRAFYIKLKTAKINKDKYRKLDVVQLNLAYINEVKYTFREYFFDFIQSFRHQCKAGDSLFEPKSRIEALKLNRKLRKSSKIVKYVMYNQINFEPCYSNDYPSYLEEYRKKTELCDIELIESLKSSNFKRINSKHKEPKVGWLEYIFRIDLPNKLSYIPYPLYRIDRDHGVLMNLFYIIGSIFFMFLILLSWLAAIYLAYENYVNFKLTYKCKPSMSRTIICTLLTCAASFLVAASVFDSGLLSYSAIVLYSRSLKVIKMLEKEVESYHSHIVKFNDLVRGWNPDEVNHKRFFMESFRKKSKLSDYSEVVNRELVEVVSGFVRKREWPSEFALNNQFLPKPCQYYVKRNQYEQMNGSSRYMENKTDDQFTFENNNIGGQDFGEFYALSKYYKDNLDSRELQFINENIDYLIDLIEVLQWEFKDLRNFHTNYLNILIIFCSIGNSIGLAVMLRFHDVRSSFIGLMTILADMSPLIFALFIGAISEGMVSIHR